MKKSNITVVIPVFNRAEIVGRTLCSIQSQTLLPERVVLVDNGSTDNSLAVIRAWQAEVGERIDVVVVSELKPGACAARNRGLQEVATEFVMFFDSDDEMLPSHVEDFAMAVRENPDKDIFGRDVVCVESDGSRRRLYFEAKNAMFNHIFRGCLSTQRMVVRTSLVRAVGGWSEDLPAWNDYELGVRLLISSNRIVKLSGEPTVVTYHLAESITGVSYSGRSDRWERSLNRVEQDLKDSNMSEFVKWVEVRRMVLAAQYRGEADSLTDLQARSNALRQASRLYGEVIGRSEGCRLRMKLIYSHNYHFKRLTWVVARLLFPFG